MRIPKRFVSLHNHSGFSSYDGLGYPNEHMEFAEKNGLDGFGLTEHGHFNSYAHSQLFIEEWHKKGKTFKYCPGIEAYFHPDLEQWSKDKALNEELAADAKLAAKERKKALASVETVITQQTDGEDETIGIETNNALTLENEEESKSTKHYNPLNRRHHLVLLPRNDRGLQELFHLTSRSYMEGFYRFPRIDLRMIREVVTPGNVVAQSACIGGLPAFNIFRTLEKVKFDDMTPALLNDPVLMEQCVTAVGNAYDMMVGAFGKEWFYLELQFNKLPAQDLVNRAMIEFARRNGVTDKLTAAADSHYYNPDVWKERELYKKLAYMSHTNYSPDSLPKSKDDLKCELYPKNATQMWDEYLKAKERHSFYDSAHDDIVCDAIERSWSIAHEVIGDVQPDRSIKLPTSLVPKDKTSIAHLTHLCKQGLVKRGLHEKPEYIERLKEELLVIKHLKMADYFITLARILDLGREVALIGPGRGSGAGSLVNYVLYITDLDPIRWDLPFARFLSVYRQGMADVDTDVSDRDKILDVMRDEFGFENVVPISNYNTTKLKSLTKDISKFYGIDFQEVNQATATVEMDVRKAVTKEGDDKNLFVLVYDEAMGFICSKRKEPGAKPVCSGCTDECTTPVSPSYRGFITKYPHVGESIKVLFKQNRSLGRHAGGVLVCDDLPKKMPLITSKGEPQSPWVEGVQYKHLEKIGNFVKFDILGLATLRLIERTIELILKRDGVQNPTFKDVRKWFDERMLVDKLDLDDQKVYETVYHNGAWCGIFQGTSKGAQRFFEEAKPRSIIDIAVLTSIYRPGPLAAKLNKLWIDVLNGKEYDWGDRRINDLLAPTKGLLIFQEGVMHLAEHVAGFPKDKCDEVRRAIMKRSISGGDAAKAKVDEMRSQFVDGAVANGYARDVAENVYEKIGFFSGYGFNKSHAISYAIDSYYCAYLLTHYPEQWLTSYLEFMSNNPDDRARAIGEVKGLGYEVIPIDVNHASKEWVALPGKKFMPSLLSCKGVGTSAIDELIERRPYQSIYDLLYDDDKQWAPSKFNKRALEALIKVEAFASLNCVGEGRLFASYRHMHHVLIERNAELKRTTKKDPHAGFNNLGRIAAETLETHGAEWSRKEQVENMVEIVGSVDVTRLVDPDLVVNLAEREVIPIDQLEEGQKSIVWFIAQAVTKKKTRNGKTYGLLEALGPSGKAIRLSVWGWKEPSIDPFSMYIAEVERNDFGCSTMFFRLKRVGGNQ